MNFFVIRCALFLVIDYHCRPLSAIPSELFGFHRRPHVDEDRHNFFFFACHKGCICDFKHLNLSDIFHTSSLSKAHYYFFLRYREREILLHNVMAYAAESPDWTIMRTVLLSFVCVILTGSVAVGKSCIYYICLHLPVLLYGVCLYGDHNVALFDVLTVLNTRTILSVLHYGSIKIIGYKKIRLFIC